MARTAGAVASLVQRVWRRLSLKSSIWTALTAAVVSAARPVNVSRRGFERMGAHELRLGNRGACREPASRSRLTDPSVECQ